MGEKGQKRVRLNGAPRVLAGLTRVVNFVQKSVGLGWVGGSFQKFPLGWVGLGANCQFSVSVGLGCPNAPTRRPNGFFALGHFFC